MIVSSPIDKEQKVDGRASSDAGRDRTDVTEDADVERMVAVAAYYIAEGRGFVPGHEIEDWLAAEEQVHDSLLLRT